MFSGYDTIIEIAAFSALLSLFLEFCFREGNIFQQWLPFIAERYLKRKGIDSTDLPREDKLELASDWFWFKPLGYCVVCMNVWITTMSISIFGLNLDPPSMLLAILFSNLLVRYFQDKIV